jgi:hypothetical protein
MTTPITPPIRHIQASHAEVELGEELRAASVARPLAYYVEHHPQPKEA